MNNNVVTSVGSGNCIISCIRKETAVNKEQMEYIYIGIAIGFMLGFAVGLWIESYLAVKNLMVEMS